MNIHQPGKPTNEGKLTQDLKIRADYSGFSRSHVSKRAKHHLQSMQMSSYHERNSPSPPALKNPVKSSLMMVQQPSSKTFGSRRVVGSTAMSNVSFDTFNKT